MGAKRKQYQEITLPESNPDSLLTATSAHAEPGIFDPRSWGPKLVDLMFPVTLDDVAQTQMGAFTPEEHKIAESTYKAWESGVERDVVALLASPLGFVPSTALAIQDAGRDIADWWSGEGGLWPAAQSVLQAAGGLTQLAPVEQREIYVKPWDLNSLEDVHEAHQRYLETGETTVLQGDSPGPPYEGQILLPPPVEPVGIPPSEDEHILETDARQAQVRARQAEYDHEFVRTKVMPFIAQHPHPTTTGGRWMNLPGAEIFRGAKYNYEPLLKVSTWGWREHLEDLGFEYVGDSGFSSLYRFPQQLKLESGEGS